MPCKSAHICLSVWPAVSTSDFVHRPGALSSKNFLLSFSCDSKNHCFTPKGIPRRAAKKKKRAATFAVASAAASLDLFWCCCCREIPFFALRSNSSLSPSAITHKMMIEAQQQQLFSPCKGTAFFFFFLKCFVGGHSYTHGPLQRDCRCVAHTSRDGNFCHRPDVFTWKWPLKVTHTHGVFVLSRALRAARYSPFGVSAATEWKVCGGGGSSAGWRDRASRNVHGRTMSEEGRNLTAKNRQTGFTVELWSILVIGNLSV